MEYRFKILNYTFKSFSGLNTYILSDIFQSFMNSLGDFVFFFLTSFLIILELSRQIWDTFLKFKESKLILSHLYQNIEIFKISNDIRYQILAISPWHILALSRSNLVLPGADKPLEELRHNVQYFAHARNIMMKYYLCRFLLFLDL